MPTIKQLIRNIRQPIRNVTKSPALRGCPQRRGTCTRVYMRFHAPLRPRKMDKFLFLGTHTRFVTTKRIMVTPPLTISFINYFIYEFHSNRNKIHVYPTETEFVTCYPLAISIHTDIEEKVLY
uniref:Ribosomal protein S12 n=1 Tax=Bruguiera gymnorhiza TaxID=39984 RepID=A0A891GP19_BRUGY|nr:ribosomal protein S12 [Bruguiera gymnorhiza]QRK25704.1 ribosomal protein S12 [Bruguiera gymnorhiza]